MYNRLLLSAILCISYTFAIGQNVGIGVEHPGSKLSVKGGISIGENYAEQTAPDGSIIIEKSMGIGTSVIDTNVVLDIKSATKGVLFPTMSSSQINSIVNPPKGLFVFNSDSSGFNFYNGTSWLNFALFGPTGPVGQTLSLLGLGGSGTSGAYNATSTGLNSISTGTKVFIASAGKSYQANDRVRISYNSSNYMEGVVTTYLAGVLTVSVDRTVGSGSYLTWKIGIAGDVGADGATGAKGATGTTGATGAAGAKGATGATGANGAAGINGVTGATGATGAAGVAGATGATGATGETNGWLLTGNSVSSTNFIGTTNNNSLKFRTNNSQRMVIDANGNVGIGTNSPDKILQIEQNSSGAGLVNIKNTSSSGYSSIDFFDQNGTQMGNVGYSNSSANLYAGAMYFATNTTSDIAFSTDNNEKMRLTSSGTLGIGTINPSSSYKLDVLGSARFTGAVKIGSYTLPTADGSNGQVLATNGSGTLSWTTISSGGCGSHTHDSSDDDDDDNNDGWSRSGNSVSTNDFIGTTNNKSFKFRTNDTQRMVIDNTGRVGIGTSSPDQLLEVEDGNIQLSNTNNTSAELRIKEPNNSGSNYTAFKAQAQSSNITYTLPDDDGSNGQVLTTDGSGELSWSTVSGGSGEGTSASHTYYDKGDDVTSISSTSSWNTISGLSRTVNLNSSGKLVISTSGGFETTSNNSSGYSSIEIAIYVDGSRIDGGYQRTIAMNNAGHKPSSGYWSVSAVASVSSGNHTVQIKAIKQSGSTADVSEEDGSPFQGNMITQIVY